MEDATALHHPRLLDGQVFIGSAGDWSTPCAPRTAACQWVFQANGPVRSSIEACRARRQHVLLFGDMTGWFYSVAGGNRQAALESALDEHIPRG